MSFFQQSRLTPVWKLVLPRAVSREPWASIVTLPEIQTQSKEREILSTEILSRAWIIILEVALKKIKKPGDAISDAKLKKERLESEGRPGGNLTDEMRENAKLTAMKCRMSSKKEFQPLKWCDAFQMSIKHDWILSILSAGWFPLKHLHVRSLSLSKGNVALLCD